jgi:diaminopropionate ammonia-lyase
MTFVTATDGNHGRAVAWSAENYGCQARVYLPKDTSQYRVDAIESHGAHAEVTEVNYDETVAYAARMADENDWILIQDTSWDDYQKIPKDIMIGYQTIVHELADDNFIWPSHVVMQAGVGSFAASIFDAFCKINRPKPKFILVEPTGAACYFKSIQAGDGCLHPIKELNTIMAGLSCGIPSILAWDIITKTADYFVTCDDDIALKAMRRLSKRASKDDSIVSGESGAVTTGFIETICSDPEYSGFYNLIGLNGSSNVFCISTEGDTNPDLYNQAVNGQ